MNDSPGSTVHDAVGKIQAQWELCLAERRKKYEQFTVSNKLKETRTRTIKAHDKERSNLVSTSNIKTVRKPGAPKKASDKSHKRNYQSGNLTESKQSASILSRTTAKPLGNRSQENSDKDDYAWKKGTVLIVGDSMLHGIDEKKFSKKWLSQSAMLPWVNYFRFAMALHATTH